MTESAPSAFQPAARVGIACAFVETADTWGQIYKVQLAVAGDIQQLRRSRIE